MPPSPPPQQPPEQREWRDTLLTFGVAFVVDWVLTTRLGWPSRRALWTSVGVGIVLALVLQRIVQRRGGR